MKVLIIEDEQATALRLKKLLVEIEPEIEVLDILDSVESCIRWYNENEAPDLVLQDIHLADGLSFEIFNEVKVDSPIIFITAYDKYALQAFKVNSVDYLLKPINKEQLKNSLNKYRQIYHNKIKLDLDYSQLAKLMASKGEIFQKRFVVRFGQTIKAIDIEEIAYFFTESGGNYFKTYDNRQYPADHSLDKIETMIDPNNFYRINRQFIISYKSIKEMYGYSKSRVRIILDPPSEYETIAATERSGAFKKWLTGKK